MLLVIICIYTFNLFVIIKFHQITGLLLLPPKVCFVSRNYVCQLNLNYILHSSRVGLYSVPCGCCCCSSSVVQSHDSSSVVQVIVRSRRFFSIHSFSIKTRVRVGRKQLSIYIRTALLTIHDWYESFFLAD